jgi:carboxypeptidase C (cathepsin A)
VIEIRNTDTFADLFSTLNALLNLVAGESYAGMYLSYTAATIYAKKHQIPLSLKGLLLIDAVFSE